MPSWEGSHNWTVTDPAQNQKSLIKQSITPPRSDDSADFALSSTEELPKSKTPKNQKSTPASFNKGKYPMLEAGKCRIC